MSFDILNFINYVLDNLFSTKLMNFIFLVVMIISISYNYRSCVKLRKLRIKYLIKEDNRLLEEAEERIHILKLHAIYIAIIASMIGIIFLTGTLYNAEEFGKQISFAGTITSIVLSIIAIFMSIVNEGKNEYLKRQLENASITLKESSDKLDINIKELESKVTGFSKNIEEIAEKVNSIKTELGEIHDTIKEQNKYFQEEQAIQVKPDIKPNRTQWTKGDTKN